MTLYNKRIKEKIANSLILFVFQKFDNYHFCDLYFSDICYMKKWDDLLAHLKFLIKRNPE